MTEHIHSWHPVPGEMARYSCACEASGYRARSGDIVEHRSKPARHEKWTARPTSDHTGRVGRPDDRASHGQWNAPSERDS